MRKKVLAACAVVCTLGVLSMICLGQIKKNHPISKLATANIEALTNGETQTSITCYSSFRVTRKSLFEPKWMFVSCLGCVNVEAYEAMDSGECNN